MRVCGFSASNCPGMDGSGSSAQGCAGCAALREPVRQLQRRLGPLRRRMRQVLDWGLRCADATAARFCRKLLKIEAAMWSFTRMPGLEPTSNLAERMLRSAVLWRKNSFGCHSDDGCRFAERMLTAVQTQRVQNRSILTWLEQTLTAHREGLAGPKLCGRE